MVYLTGTIKFLTLSQACLQEMIRNNALKALTNLLQHTKEKVISLGGYFNQSAFE